MLGKLFVILNNQMQPVASGVIAERIDQSHYLCRFNGEPQHSQVFSTETLTGMLLFDNAEDLQAWVEKASGAPAAAPESEPDSKDTDSSEE
jgi:hypothetical protein